MLRSCVDEWPDVIACMNSAVRRLRRLCNAKIISDVQQIICFAFHDSKVLLETCREAKENKTIVTLLYLD